MQSFQAGSRIDEFCLPGCEPSARCQAADEFGDCKVIRLLPKTTAEMDRLHRDNSGNQCEPLGDGQSLETTDFSIIKTVRESLEKSPRPARATASSR